MYIKYEPEFKLNAVKLVKVSGLTYQAAAEKMGVSTYAVWKWCQDRIEKPRKHQVRLTPDEKCILAQRFITQGWSGPALAAEYNISASVVYTIVKEYRQKGPAAFMCKARKGDKPKTGADSFFEMQDLPDDIDKLKKICHNLELRNAVLEQTIEVLKKDPGADPSEMTNLEKTTVIDALKSRFAVRELCKTLAIPHSSYYYVRSVANKPDPYAKARIRIRDIFEKSKMTYGSERIWVALQCGDDGKEPLKISEKVIRRIMGEEGLVVIYNKERRHYNSYKGEISAHPGNKVERNFHADKPNELWLTDITQFTLPKYKCYLSAIIDCFDGKVVSHRLSLSPDAELTNSTLKSAIYTLRAGEHPTCHSDCGCHYRWPGWIELCADNNIERSMSRKDVRLIMRPVRGSSEDLRMNSSTTEIGRESTSRSLQEWLTNSSTITTLTARKNHLAG